MPQYIWSDGLPLHSLENTGSEDLALTAIELKSPSAVRVVD